MLPSPLGQEKLLGEDKPLGRSPGSQEVFAASGQAQLGHRRMKGTPTHPAWGRRHGLVPFGCWRGSEAKRLPPGTPSLALLLPRPHTRQGRQPRRARWSRFTGHAAGCSSSSLHQGVVWFF